MPPLSRLDAVCAFVERYGVRVFPCRTNNKAPIQDGGFHRATSDLDQIRKWSRQWPDCNWGMATGALSGYDVLDVDTKHGKDGLGSLRQLEERIGKLPETPTVLTPGGGWHYYFKCNGTPIRSTAGELGPGLDTRGVGGYVLIPPSVIDGKAYTFEASSDPADVPFAEMPPQLIELLAEKKATQAPTSPDGTVTVLEGGRNAHLTSRAGSMRRAGMSAEAILAALRVENTERCSPPLPEPEVATIARSVARYAPDPEESATGLPVVMNTTTTQRPDDLDRAAFHGLAGDIVMKIAPETEADPAALLLQFLTAFGAHVGRGPHYRVEGDQHHGNLFCVLVGDTAKARKGTSWGRVRQVFSPDGFPSTVSGLSSGEGLKWHVRDPILKLQTDKKTGIVEEIETDPGVADKRLLVIEPEFAQVLRQGARAGNTLSPTLRCAWDGDRLSTLTKNDPVTATGAHISIIAHVTADELRAELSATDAANGFGNRFLFMAVARSKKLPHGGKTLPPDFLKDIGQEINRLAVIARERGAIPMTNTAAETWTGVYPVLSEGLPGLFGAVTARAEAQCIRLALLYALLDGEGEIDRPHLLAALAVWERSQASAQFIFGSAIGDPVADEILRSLRASGELTRTDIRDLFKRHQSADRIGVALDLLKRRGLAHAETKATAGRPTEVWRAGVATKAI